MTKRKQIEEELRQQLDGMKGKSIPDPDNYPNEREAALHSEKTGRTLIEGVKLAREFRDLLHSDYCGRRCVPRCVELSALLGEPPSK